MNLLEKRIGAEIPDKKKFLIDMIFKTKKENFEIAETLRLQSRILEELADIARKVGNTKQNALEEIDKIADYHDISWDRNHRNIAYLRFEEVKDERSKEM